MPDRENTNSYEEVYGAVHISDEVVSAIAALAISEVKGVVGTTGGGSGGLPEFWGKKSAGKGIKVSFTENNGVVIDANIIVEYGSKIPEVAKLLQEKMKNQVETMTGVRVESVNIHIQGVNVESTPKEKEEN